MRNIILITPLYPIPTKENKASPVCHFFTREWVKKGYNVIVIHQQPVYSWLWYMVLNIFGNYIENKVGGGNFYKSKLKGIEEYKMDEVQVFRIPIYNFIPRGRYSSSSIKHFTDKVHRVLSMINFKPDIITSHMMSLEIIHEINKPYKAKTCSVFHGYSSKSVKRYNNYEELLNSFNILGFRSQGIQNIYKSVFSIKRPTFICYSGIPSSYISHSYRTKLGESISKYIYVGSLIKRKYPVALLSPIKNIKRDNPFSLTYVGEGMEKENIIKKADILNISKNIHFTGKIPRDKIIELLDSAECFIMISRGEAFGLVYLEAMARGCLVIASRGEGVDGIIVDNENGFLCDAGSEEELTDILKKIDNLSLSEKLRISRNAIDTAKLYTDENSAMLYLNTLID